MRFKLTDLTVFLLMGVLAGCGILYEYLISHYAGRVLGSIETVIYSVIGLMIVAMGFGAFLARFIKDPYKGFAILEVAIAFVGITSILVIGFSTGIAALLPTLIQNGLNLPADIATGGALVHYAQKLTTYIPYVIAFILGLMIGIEIPLIARIREHMYQRHLENNAGSIYGADYIGAGLGAFLWIAVLISMPATEAAVIVASLNLAVGLTFITLFRKQIGQWFIWSLLAHIAMGALVFFIHCQGSQLERQMESLLYQDKLVTSINSTFQHLTVTEKISGEKKERCFFINNRTQFCTQDEKAYHSMMVSPAMHLANNPKKVLIVGGGDGLALRDVLQWPVESVILMDLDPELIDFFSNPKRDDNDYFLDLNQRAYDDPRVSLRFGDAFLGIRALVSAGETFDVILVDLPDPSHPDLNKLYSTAFYKGLSLLLEENGALAIQSTSPQFAKSVFIGIANTVSGAGFPYVDQYKTSIPSFGGEWGWTIASKRISPKQSLSYLDVLTREDGYMTPELMKSAFAFPAGFYKDKSQYGINTLGSGKLYNEHKKSWK